YRWQGNQECGIGAAEAVEKATLTEGPETVGAVIAEPIMGAGGVIVPPESYFPKLRQICDQYEVLLIADEVITGFGRTGRWFALDHWDVEPDIVSFAKGVTSGYLPLGGNILSKRVHDAILNAPLDRRYMHAATYSGHPVCCAVGLRNIEIIESESLVERAAVMGRRLMEGLRHELGELPDGAGSGSRVIPQTGHPGRAGHSAFQWSTTRTAWPASERELRPHCYRIEIPADRCAERRPCDAAARRRGEPLVDAPVQVIEHEADVGIRVPVQSGCEHGLLAAAHGVTADGRCDARYQVIVEVYRADASRQLERPKTVIAVPWRKRMQRNRV